MECCCSYVDLYGLKTIREIMWEIKTVSEVPLGDRLIDREGHILFDNLSSFTPLGNVVRQPQQLVPRKSVHHVSSINISIQTPGHFIAKAAQHIFSRHGKTMVEDPHLLKQNRSGWFPVMVCHVFLWINKDNGECIAFNWFPSALYILNISTYIVDVWTTNQWEFQDPKRYCTI